MPIPTYVVDAFADEPFKGNPAGVCLVDSFPADETMLAIAAELKHAETAFLVKLSDSRYHLRWFTPRTEVDLCGHATLASAHVLWESGRENGSTIRFETLSGELTAGRNGSEIELDFPALHPLPAMVAGLEAVLGQTPRYLGQAGLFLLAVMDSEASVRNFAPDFQAISRLGDQALLITAKGHSDAYDFVSRLFAPQVGIDEDPVTGSAHCVLAPYWSPILDKKVMVGYQASERGGFVGVEYRGARVGLRGSAITVLEGSLRAEAC
jgi:PhzF family phenazine biosynthesis protein